MNLYDLKAEVLKAYEECIDQETGEVIDPDKLSEVCGNFNEKVENTICLIKNINAEVKAMKEEKSNLDARIKVRERKADGLKKYLSIILEGNKFEGTRGSISYRASQETLCDLESLKLNDNWERFVTVKTECVPNKDAIKEAIKNGEEVFGATVIDKQNIQIK